MKPAIHIFLLAGLRPAEVRRQRRRRSQDMWQSPRQVLGNAARATAAAALAIAMIGAGQTLANNPSKHLIERTTTSVCGLDMQFLQSSAEGDMFEIQGGKLALSKSKLPEIRTLAQRLIKDHTKSLADTKALAAKYDVALPKSPSPSQQWELEELTEMSVATFNHDYSELEVMDHMQDIDEATNEVNWGCNADVRGSAKDEIPVLKIHLQLSKVAVAAAGPER